LFIYLDKKALRNFVLIFICLFTVLIIPSIISVQNDVQNQITMEYNDQKSQLATVSSIFNNNLLVSCVSLVPYAGWGILLAVLWQTGVVVASYGLPWYYILFNPFAYVELCMFSFVVLRSVHLVRLFFRRKTKFIDLEGKWVIRKTTGVYYDMIKTVAIVLIVCSVVLLLSAFAEIMWLQR
jgi:hypothetical protein